MSQQPRRQDAITRHLGRLKELVEQNAAKEETMKEIERCLELVPAKEEYSDQITTQASKELEQLEKDTRSHPWDQLFEQGKTQWKISPGMMSGNLEVQLLKSLITMSKAKRVLEIGCFCGYGALGMAEALPADGVVISCELSPYLQDLARKFVDRSPHGKKVTIKPGPAKDTMIHLAESKEQFDLIFMDADKPGYIEYYKLIFEKNLLAPNGTIAVDNAFGGGYTWSREQRVPESTMGPSIDQFNQMVLKDDSIHRVMLPLKDGVMLIRRKSEVEGKC